MGFYPPAVLVGDARRHGVAVLPVDVNRSGVECSVEQGSGLGAERWAVRLGFKYVKGLGEAACARIEAAQADARQSTTISQAPTPNPRLPPPDSRPPFHDLHDFCRRTGLDRRSVERLIAVGAFDGFGRPRRELLWELPTILAELRAGELPGLSTVAATLESPLPAVTELEEANLDYGILGLSTRHHAMEFYRPSLRAQGVRTADELPELPSGRAVSVAGLVICRQAPPTAGGHVFLTLEDETGLANIIVRPQVYQRERAVARSHPVVIVEGVLQNQEGALSVLARHFTALGREQLAGTVRSRDFH